MCIHGCVCRFICFCDHVCVYMRAYESERASLDVVYQSLPTFSPFKTGSLAGRKYLFSLGWAVNCRHLPVSALLVSGL